MVTETLPGLLAPSNAALNRPDSRNTKMPTRIWISLQLVPIPNQLKAGEIHFLVVERLKKRTKLES